MFCMSGYCGLNDGFFAKKTPHTSVTLWSGASSSQPHGRARSGASYGMPHQIPGRLRVSSVVADVSTLHRDPAHRHALFQVASQFNLLEMTGPHVTPEDGVTRYAHDRTQGPACAIAAGAATIYRNYFVPVDGEVGQTRHRQIDCLRDIGTALGNDRGSLWTMQNGYALCTESGLAAITRRLGQMPANERDALRDRLRVGVHHDVQVTISDDPGQRVTQVFCSALPVAYSRIPAEQWAPFASLVLEGAYEATLSAAVLNAARNGSRPAFLTSLGGGALRQRSGVDSCGNASRAGAGAGRGPRRPHRDAGAGVAGLGAVGRRVLLTGWRVYIEGKGPSPSKRDRPAALAGSSLGTMQPDGSAKSTTTASRSRAVAARTGPTG